MAEYAERLKTRRPMWLILAESAKADPFIPFRVVLASGYYFDVGRPENIEINEGDEIETFSVDDADGGHVIKIAAITHISFLGRPRLTEGRNPTADTRRALTELESGDLIPCADADDVFAKADIRPT